MGSNPENSTQQQVDDDVAYLLALQFSYSNVLPAILNAAIELNLFEIIARGNPFGGSMTPSEIASHLPNQYPNLPHKLDRMLRLLASHSLLISSVRRTGEDGDGERVYELSPAGKYFVNDDHGKSLASCSDMYSHPALIEAWLNCKDAILEDGIDIFKKTHGMPIFQYMESDPKLNKIFNKTMADMSSTQMKKVLQVYEGFEGISTLVDVGGGSGLSLRIIVNKYPSIKGVNFDLPQVIEIAPSHPRIEHVEGNMFQSVPSGDAIMMKFVCHDWDDERCLQLLKNCHKALPPNGKVIVIDMILPEEPESTTASKYVSTIDAVMFFQAGRERTKKEFETLCKRSGFSTFQFVCCAFFVLGVMEFRK